MIASRGLMLWLFLAGVFLLLGLSAAYLRMDARRRVLDGRVARLALREQGPSQDLSVVLAFVRHLGNWARQQSQLYSKADLEHLQALVLSAGFNPKRVLPLLLGAKVALMLALPLAAFFVSSFVLQSLHVRLLITAGGVAVGMLGPDFVLNAMRRSYLSALERATPDALDLLIMCSEAGLGLESAIERVAQDMPRASKPMAIALNGLLDDLRVLPDRGEAFQNFARRTGSEGLQRLATVLSQAIQFGTPLGQALRAVAAELRRDRMTRLEERAVRLPLKLIMPMMLFMLPTLWIMLAGTAFLKVFDAFSAMHPHTAVQQSQPR